MVLLQWVYHYYINDNLLGPAQQTPEAHPQISQQHTINVISQTVLLQLSKLSPSLPPTNYHETSYLKRTQRWKCLNKMLHPQNRTERKQQILKYFEKVCSTIEKRGSSFRYDAMAIEMNKIKLTRSKLIEKNNCRKAKKELCHTCSPGKYDQK